LFLIFDLFKHWTASQNLTQLAILALAALKQRLLINFPFFANTISVVMMEPIKIEAFSTKVGETLPAHVGA
jgi:hypothetical protein